MYSFAKSSQVALTEQFSGEKNGKHKKEFIEILQDFSILQLKAMFGQLKTEHQHGGAVLTINAKRPMFCRLRF